ncbi:MAG: hypothetical protein IKT38_07390 [Clostridia bacterium]|nr:hypothetical protein [Clostridia bacterium]
MKFKIFSTKIYISFFFMAVFTVMLATDRTGLILPLFFAIIMHECGHLFCMWAEDVSLKQIKIIPSGIQIISGFSGEYKKDIKVALCGPIVNIALFVILYFNYLSFGNEQVLNYALLNLIIAIYNLLPVKGLDGGTILYSIIARKSNINKAEITLKFITLSVAIAVLITAVLLTVNDVLNISIYIVGIYLFIISLIK